MYLGLTMWDDDLDEYVYFFVHNIVLYSYPHYS